MGAFFDGNDPGQSMVFLNQFLKKGFIPVQGCDSKDVARFRQPISLKTVSSYPASSNCCGLRLFYFWMIRIFQSIKAVCCRKV